MSKEIDIPYGHIECDECEGTGRVFYSCCGDDIRGNDIDLCPTCYEHCDIEDGEECESCQGLGYVMDPKEIAKIKQLYDRDKEQRDFEKEFYPELAGKSDAEKQEFYRQLKR